MCLSVGVRESTNVSLSGSEGVDECVSVGVRASTNVSSQWE